MKLEQQVVTLEQAKKLKELGVAQNSLFYWQDKHYNERSGGNMQPVEAMVVPVNFYNGTSPKDLFYSAFTVAEMLHVLRGKMPYWIAIWGEWGYKSKKGQGVGYGNMAEACGWRLIEALETKELSAEEVNQRLAE